MKKFHISLISLLLMMVLVVPMSAVVNDDIKVYVDGQKVSFPDQAPYINSESRTVVPVRFVSQALGATVNWDGTTQRVNISQNGKSISLKIGEKKALVDSAVVTLDTNAIITNDRTMVPLRFVSECLGATVQWKGDTREIFIESLNYASDSSLIDSDLKISTPPPGDNPNNVNLIAHVFYLYNTPVAPQLVDLQELLEERFGDKASPIMEYIRSKDGTNTHLETKDWTIDGKHVSVYDAIGEVSITIWN